MTEEGKIYTEMKWYLMFLKNRELRQYYDLLSGRTALIVPGQGISEKRTYHFQIFIYTASNHRNRVEKCSYSNEEYLRRTEATRHAMDVLDGETGEALSADTSAQAIAGGGYLFVYAPIQELQTVLGLIYPRQYLIVDHNTGKPAVVPDQEMKEFIYMYESSPWNLELLTHPIEEYIKKRQRIRITGGLLKGKVGYITRLHRNMKIVFTLGNMTISLGNFSSLPFERIDEEGE